MEPFIVLVREVSPFLSEINPGGNVGNGDSKTCPQALYEESTSSTIST
jgi:hypothetical protein